MAIDQATLSGYPYEDALPSRSPDGSGGLAYRLGQYGELFTKPIAPWRVALADEGSLHEFHNATLDDATTLAGHAAPVVADIDATFIKPFFFIGLLASANPNKKLYIHWIEQTVTLAAATGADSWWADETDLISRYTSGGTALTVVNPNTGAPNALGTDVATFLGGPVLVPAETSSNRKLGFSKYRQTIEVIGDYRAWVYGDSAPPSTQAASPTGRVNVFRRPPVILTPGYAYMLAIAGSSTNAAGIYHVRGEVSYR